MFAMGLSVFFILDVSALYVKHQFLHRRHTYALPNYQSRMSELSSLFSASMLIIVSSR